MMIKKVVIEFEAAIKSEKEFNEGIKEVLDNIVDWSTECDVMVDNIKVSINGDAVAV